VEGSAPWLPNPWRELRRTRAGAGSLQGRRRTHRTQRRTRFPPPPDRASRGYPSLPGPHGRSGVLDFLLGKWFRLLLPARRSRSLGIEGRTLPHPLIVGGLRRHWLVGGRRRRLVGSGRHDSDPSRSACSKLKLLLQIGDSLPCFFELDLQRFIDLILAVNKKPGRDQQEAKKPFHSQQRRRRRNLSQAFVIADFVGAMPGRKDLPWMRPAHREALTMPRRPGAMLNGIPHDTVDTLHFKQFSGSALFSIHFSVCFDLSPDTARECIDHMRPLQASSQLSRGVLP
jgi:hypothetical protein